MTNDETDQATNSPPSSPTRVESSTNVETVSDDTVPAEEEAQQSPKKRFSFYDAKAVGSIGLGSSGSSFSPTISPTKEEIPNPNRFRFYDPSIAVEKSNIPSTLNSHEVSDSADQQDVKSDSEVAKISEATKSSMSAVDSDDDVKIPTAHVEKEDIMNSSADEILRSLQETEDQRMKILQPTTASLQESSGSVLSNGSREDPDAIAHGGGSAITGVDIAASTAAVINSKTPFTNSNGTDIDNNSLNNNNPYEDTIRTALNLLRKHRSSPKYSSSADNAFDADESGSNYNTSSSRDMVSDIKLDQDPILQERSYDHGDGDEKNDDEISIDNAVQEAKMKSKQRQERMAKYASRLQELKSSLPPEQQLKQPFSPSYTPSNNNADVDINTQDSSAKNDSSPLEKTNMESGADKASPGNQSEQQLPHHIHRHIKPSFTEDSTGLVSELSQYSNNYSQRPQHSNLPQQQHAIIEEQVQKGVEKVLVAILEASKNKGATGSGADSSCGEGSNGNTLGHMDNMSTTSGENANDALLQVLHELLPSSRSIDSGSLKTRDMGGGATGALSSKYSSSVVSESSLNNRSRKSSVVDELLAEVDDEDHAPKSKTPATTNGTINSNTNAAQYWAEGDEKKMTDDRKYSDNQHSSETDTTSVVLASINQGKINNPVTNTADLDIDKNEDDATNENSLFESDASGADDMGSRPSYSDEEDDDMDTTYDEDEESYSEHEKGGVLGPLSREAGGTTGVVLDVESDHSSPSPTEKGYFAAEVNHLTSSAIRVDEQRVLDHKKKSEILANYDVVGTTTNIQDEEAKELMRTLCAHLLPFGVDQNSSRDESTPVWDEKNDNEPGYRIIRLSRSQLRRVECAFDAMITRLKHNSHTHLNGLEGHFDENFIRELEEAERLLDDEEERNKKESMADDAPIEVTPKIQTAPSVDTADEDESAADIHHPEFPGVKSAGKGEMGDLEYFQLPIIYKSHVTGFEPTKDMALEPGNIIAGQYLVESELGSAAFSTAYRCVDLSSEDNDGHEEVCLKVIKNTKDFFDQSLDEIKILELLRQTGKCDENYILRVKTFFYYREHLIIVTELLRQNLFEFGKFILDNDEEPYFTLPRLAYITRQCLVALRFVHNLGLVHSDVKPENILLGSYSRAQIKLIDFGSSCYLTDRQSSYIQSRSYRAPEVVLGLPYDGKIDVWSLGCVVAEMYTGEVTFQNDSIVSMLSRIEAFRGSFPRHMIAQGRQCGRFFTKSGLLYEVVGQSEDEEGLAITPPAPDDEDSASDAELERVEFDIFQPKSTRLSSRLRFDSDLMDDYGRESTPAERKLEQMFTDFVAKLLTIDPDNRPTAEEALNHPYMLYAASLTDEQIKYPSS
eukprot:CAMPEP_0116150446 /NCGR_PEP_ID=MMETSP0329-20121206/19553_1 /TAXON_ID=697910 /ORGANISM="Pseudo-nitzschia arenysensis, Strain B593" /LENGTH=1360 /DNA_ID=CAMNT_0003646963 /DNA_START=169 /DNA_END=4251 /DNA_ORIENTATION=-